jgi:hypothetical protein
VAGLTPEEFEREYLSRGAPVVIEGGAAEWPAREAWAPERLKQRLATRKVKVASSERDVFGYDEAEAAYDVEELDFADAADLVTRARPSSRRYYLMQQSIPREFPELAADLPSLPYLGRAKAHPHLWFGSEGNLTPLHYDMANNLFGQLYGRKRFLVFDPFESDRLYPRPARSKHHNLSELDPEQADLARHPRFAEAHPWTCEVGPGDLFFLPAFWWHQVRSLEAGLSVSIWWAPRPAQFLTPMARRIAPVLYERDRLLTLKASVSEPGEHQGFPGMARFMEAQDQPALALLFAGAALEDALRMLYLKHVKPSDPAVLRDAGRMADALHAAGALGAADQGAVHEWLGGIAAAVAGGEVAAAPVAAILGFVDRNRR